MKILDRKKYLRNKRPPGELLSDKIEGEIIKTEEIKGTPLWKKIKPLNEEEDTTNTLNEVGRI